MSNQCANFSPNKKRQPQKAGVRFRGPGPEFFDNSNCAGILFLLSVEDQLEGLTTFLLDFSAALADFEFWVALANHVDSPASLHDLAIGVAVF